jgi:hypothetical protein
MVPFQLGELTPGVPMAFMGIIVSAFVGTLLGSLLRGVFRAIREILRTGANWKGADFVKITFIGAGLLVILLMIASMSAKIGAIGFVVTALVLILPNSALARLDNVLREVISNSPSSEVKEQ